MSEGDDSNFALVREVEAGRDGGLWSGLANEVGLRLRFIAVDIWN